MVEQLWTLIHAEAVLRYLLVGYLILLFPFSACLNGFLIILMATIKLLHQTVYFLALQVVMVDFGLIIFVTPITIANAIAGKCTFDPTFCSLSIFVIHLIRMTRYWLMFVFVSDLGIFPILVFTIPEKVCDHPVHNGLGYFTLFCYYFCLWLLTVKSLVVLLFIVLAAMVARTPMSVSLPDS